MENFEELIKAETDEEMLSAALDYIVALEKENSRLRDELTEEQWKTEEAQWDAEWRGVEIERLKKELAEARRGVLLETGKPLWKFERVGRKSLEIAFEEEE